MSRIPTPIITVIVPVYNKRDYVSRCIESILMQTYNNLQIVLVDDGSTDGSSDICDEFAAKDSRIEVIHKENEGASSARNRGIAAAKGDYIGFVDADDYIDSDMYQTLYNVMRKHDAKLAICGITHIKGNEIQYMTADWEKEEVFSSEEAVNLLLQNRGIDYSVCNKLHHHSLLDCDSFPEGTICEDVVITGLELLKSERIVHTGRNMYYYYHRKNTVTDIQDISSIKAFLDQSIKLYDLLQSNCSGSISNISELITHNFELVVKYAIDLAFVVAHRSVFKLVLALLVITFTAGKRGRLEILRIYGRLIKKRELF